MDEKKKDPFLKRFLRHFITCLVVVALFLLVWQLLMFVAGLFSRDNGKSDESDSGADSAVVYMIPEDGDGGKI